MNSKERTKKHFDETAASYNESSDGKFVQPMYQSLIEAISHTQGQALLDIGCGNGNLFSYLRNDKLQLYGVDFSDKMIEEAKKEHGDYARFQVADAENLPFEKETFDILVCNASFHHYVHPKTVLDNMYHVAKPGCTLLIGDPYAPQPIRGIANIFTKYSNEGDYHYYGIREMKKLLSSHGFDLIQEKRTGDHTILYTAVKKESIQ